MVCKALNVQARVWRQGHTPRYEITLERSAGTLPESGSAFTTASGSASRPLRRSYTAATDRHRSRTDIRAGNNPGDLTVERRHEVVTKAKRPRVQRAFALYPSQPGPHSVPSCLCAWLFPNPSSPAHHGAPSTQKVQNEAKGHPVPPAQTCHKSKAPPVQPPLHPQRHRNRTSRKSRFELPFQAATSAMTASRPTQPEGRACKAQTAWALLDLAPSASLPLETRSSTATMWGRMYSSLSMKGTRSRTRS